MPAEQGDKTEAPTPRRRQEARERGQVAKSVELNSALLLLGSVVTLRWLAPGMLHAMTVLIEDMLGSEMAPAAFVDDLMRVHVRSVWTALTTVLPLLAVLAILAAAANFVQVGPLLTLHPLKPKFSKLNPMNGISRLFSLRSLVQLAVNLLKLTIVTWIAWRTVDANLPLIMAAVEFEHRQILALIGDLCFWLGLKIGAVLLFLALLDFAYHRWQHERDLRMSREEVKEEMRRMEGDPMLKHRRRQIQMQLAMRRLQKDVPTADVVVTNPTELAIALRYDEHTMTAPVVVAKGAGLIARRIRELAIAHGIPIIERKPLAQALFKTAEVGREVPAGLYKAIAEILAYVYELNGRRRRRATA